jgi:hypothetical protein
LQTSCDETKDFRLLVGFVNLDCEVRAAQFAQHAFDAGFRTDDFGKETIHLEYPGRAELDANAAALAVILDNFHAGFFAHSGLLLENLFRCG